MNEGNAGLSSLHPASKLRAFFKRCVNLIEKSPHEGNPRASRKEIYLPLGLAGLMAVLI